MKTKYLLMSTITLAILTGEANHALAVEYNNSGNAQSTAEITFERNNAPIEPVSPDDPETIIHPVNPINQHGGELMITYASKINFGRQSKFADSWNALGDMMQDGSTITPVVSIHDSRGSERKGWHLTAKMDEDFKTEAGKVLKGAELTYSNLYYAAVNGAPKAKRNQIVLNTEAQEIASAGETEGMGSWSLGLGKLYDDKVGDNTVKKTNGVTLTVPKKNSKDAATYSTSITYELTTEPSGNA